MRVLIYVYNISGYFLAEVEALSKIAEVAVWEVPCKLSAQAHCDNPNIRWIDRNVVNTVCNLKDHCRDWCPNVYLCVGWVDRVAIECADFVRSVGGVSVLMVDTPWRGDCRQRIHALFSRFTLVPRFDFAWGAGISQARHLEKLGFAHSVIYTGIYAADTKKFSALYYRDRHASWPHVFLYVGRYIPVKNMRRMERAFIKAIEECPRSDWRLLCIGDGPLWRERVAHERISHIGYVNPKDMQEHVADAGCFVLPSLYEPWGVVVHEFAIMGLPMICSRSVQSTSKFLTEGENGFSFNPKSEDDISKAMIRIMNLSDECLKKMGDVSHMKGMSYTTDDWAKTVVSFWR